MKKLVIVAMFLFLFSFVSAAELGQDQLKVHYFYSTACSHCAIVVDSGILDKVSFMENVSVEKYEVTLTQKAREKYLYFADGFGFSQNDRGIPFLVIEKNGTYDYLKGDTPIIDHLEDSIINFRGISFNGNTNNPFIGKLTVVGIIGAALIDSINPCAIGVLLFLMAVLLSMGSSKRAFRAAMIYTFVIFIVYLLLGLGIRQLISSFSILNYVQIIAGVIILAGALIEFKDFFWEGRGFSLKIPDGAKPLLEKYVRRGTFPAIIVLGVLVALVELPCTGGIYLGVLSLISMSELSGVFYLVLYNIIFVLPLIIVAYLIYNGAKVDVMNNWIQGNKRYMRLTAGLIMIFLAGKLLGVF